MCIVYYLLFAYLSYLLPFFFSFFLLTLSVSYLSE